MSSESLQKSDIINKADFFPKVKDIKFNDDKVLDTNKKEEVPYYLDYSWQVYRVVSLIILFLLFFIFKAFEVYLKSKKFDEYLIDVYKVFSFFMILNIVIYLFMVTYNRYRSTVMGPSGSMGKRGKRGLSGENNNCDICSPKVSTFKKLYNVKSKKEYIKNPDIVVDVKSIGSRGWVTLDSVGSTQPEGSNFISVLDNTSIGVNCNEKDTNCVHKTAEISDKNKPIIGVACNFDKSNNNIYSLQYFVDKNNKHSSRVYRPGLLGKRRFGDLKNRGEKLNFICPPNSSIYKVDSITSNDNIKGLKFYCQDVKTGKDVSVIDSKNNKMDGFVFGKEPKEDDNAYYFKSVQCNSVKDRSDEDKYYPTFISNISGGYNNRYVKNLSFNKCSYYKNK
jgi:hypothetical protein